MICLSVNQDSSILLKIEQKYKISIAGFSFTSRNHLICADWMWKFPPNKRKFIMENEIAVDHWLSKQVRTDLIRISKIWVKWTISLRNIPVYTKTFTLYLALDVAAPVSAVLFSFLKIIIIIFFSTFFEL